MNSNTPKSICICRKSRSERYGLLDMMTLRGNRWRYVDTSYKMLTPYSGIMRYWLNEARCQGLVLDYQTQQAFADTTSIF